MDVSYVEYAGSKQMKSHFKHVSVWLCACIHLPQHREMHTACTFLSRKPQEGMQVHRLCSAYAGRTTHSKSDHGKYTANSERTQWAQDMRHFICACTNMPGALQIAACMQLGHKWMWHFLRCHILESTRKCTVGVVVVRDVGSMERQNNKARPWISR